MVDESEVKLIISDFSDSSKRELIMLQQQAKNAPAFYKPAFLEAWEESTGVGIKLAKLVDSEGIIRAVLPGKIKSGSRFENITFRGWDHLDVISEDAEHSQLLITLLCKKYRVVSLMSFQETQQYEKLPNLAFTSSGTKCPYLELPNAFGVLLETLSVSFRKTVRRKLNKFYKDGGEIIFVDHNSPEAGQAPAFEELWDLHSKRAVESGKTTRFTSEDVKKFHKNLCRQASKKEGVSIIFFKAKMNGKIIGVYYCFVADSTIYYFNSGIDPEFSLYSPGMVLMSASIEWAINQSLHRYDFLRGTESYKFHWTEKVRLNKNYYFASTPFPGLKAFPAYFNDQRKRYGTKKVLMDMLKGHSGRKSKPDNV